jgi:hypothetical protein
MVTDRAPTTPQGPNGDRYRSGWRRVLEDRLRLATADLRPVPSFVILGAQRAGTTSLYNWLCAHPKIKPARTIEVHYFDNYYDRGERWYRSHFPLLAPGQMTGEASPYLLFHPLAPERVARDLPASTLLIALLRNPVERALSHYWLQRRQGHEAEDLPRALELEQERLAGAVDRVARGERNYQHRHFSYMERGIYAPQLRRWFDHVGRDRLLVIESEQLFSDPDVRATVLGRIGLAPTDVPFPALNAAQRETRVDDATLATLEARFEKPNAELFELLGRRLWVEPAGA